MILLIIILLNLGISRIVLFLIRKGKIVKYSRFLKYINIIHIISIGLLILFDFCFVESREDAICSFFIYALLGIIVLILNLVFLLLNRFFKT